MENKSEIEHIFRRGLCAVHSAIDYIIFFFCFIRLILFLFYFLFFWFSVNTELAKRKWNFHGLHSMQMVRE